MHAVQPPVMGLHGGSLLQEGCPVERQEVLTVHFQGKAMQLQQLAQKRLLQGTSKTVVSKGVCVMQRGCACCFTAKCCRQCTW